MTNRTRRAIIITAAVLVIAGIGVGGYLYGRSTTATPDPTLTPAGPATTPAAASPSASYEPTDEWGSPEPALPRGQAEAGAGGTTTGPGGLPLGYSHDQTGAVNAATNYLMWMNSLKITDKKLADDMAAATAADDATKQAMIESFDALRPGMADLTADQPEPPGRIRGRDYSADRALIYVWSPEVATETAGQTRAPLGYRRRHRSSGSNGDWKLDGGLITKTGARRCRSRRSGRKPQRRGEAFDPVSDPCGPGRDHRLGRPILVRVRQCPALDRLRRLVAVAAGSCRASSLAPIKLRMPIPPRPSAVRWQKKSRPRPARRAPRSQSFLLRVDPRELCRTVVVENIDPEGNNTGVRAACTAALSTRRQAAAKFCTKVDRQASWIRRGSCSWTRWCRLLSSWRVSRRRRRRLIVWRSRCMCG